MRWTSDSLWVETADTPSGVPEAGLDLLSLIVSKKEVTSGWIEVIDSTMKIFISGIECESARELNLGAQCLWALASYLTVLAPSSPSTQK